MRPLPRRIERRVRLARWLLVWERLWTGLWTAVVLTGLFIACALFGVFTGLPLAAHWALLGVFALLIATALWTGLRGFRWPDRNAAIQHLETASGLTHQPLSAYEDVPAVGSGDATLWHAHQAWLASRLKKLKLGFVAPGLTALDPYALRAIVVLLLVIGIAGTGPGRATRVMGAFFPGSGAARTVSIEAWITPPAYTGLAPIYLEQGETGTTKPAIKPVADTGIIKVPVGSILSLRAHGLRNPPALETGNDDRGRPEALTDLGDRNFSLDTKITASAEFALTQGGRLLRGWTVETIADQPPTIAFTQPLAQTASGSLHFAYKVADDYGVTQAEARIELANIPHNALAPGATTQTQNTATPPAFLRHARATAHVTPPVINLPLKTLRPKSGEGETYIDLTPHPWAGLPVTVTLVAKDDAGHKGLSTPIALTLPARSFTKPLAAATIEQRRALAFEPTSTTRVARILDDLTIDGDRYIADPSVYLGLRAAYWRLRVATRDSDLTGIFDLLWSVALRIEDGDLSIAESDLRRARDALTKALSSGAGEDEIAQLLNEMRDAFQRYMDALAEKGESPDQAMMEKFAPQDGQTINRDQLEKMLSQIGEMARSGAREEARKMLERMQSIMENMQTPDQNRAMSDSEKAMADAVDRMGDMINQQRELMDKTFRQKPTGDEGDQGQGDNQNPTGNAKHNEKALQALKHAQEELRGQFEALLKDLKKSGIDIPNALGKAGQDMKNAEQRLDDGRADRATTAQGQAIKGMREGAQGLVDKLAQSMMGRRGQGQAKRGPGADPLGRGSNPTTQTDGNVPSQIDRQTARDIIEELRRRANQLGRPKIELDYLERLLDQY